MSGTTNESNKDNVEDNQASGLNTDVPGRSLKRIIYLGLIATVIILVIYAVAVSLMTSSVTAKSPQSTQYTGVQNGGPMVGKQVPPVTLPSLVSASQSFSLKKYIGHPLVLNFFASWCVPCKTELPEFASLAKKDAGKVQFVGIDENDTRSSGQGIVKSTRVSYPTGFDGSGSLVQPFHLIGLPTTLFINSKGVIVRYIAGQISSSTLKAGIASIAKS